MRYRDNKMQKIRVLKAAKEISWITFGQVLVVLGGLVGVRILTNYLTPTQYGELSLGLSVGLLINVVFIIPISNGASRFFSSSRLEEDSGNYFKALFNIIVKVFVLILIFSTLLIIIFSSIGFQKWIDLLIASLCFGCFFGLNNMSNNIQNASRKRHIVAIHKGLMTFFRFLFAVLSIKFFGNTTLNTMYGQAVGMFIVFLSQIFFLKKLLNESNSQAIQNQITNYWESKIIKYSWPFATWGILGWLLNSIDRWALLFFSSAETVGLYAAIYQIGYYPISIIVGLLTNYIEPIYYQKAGDGEDPGKIRNTFRLAMKINLTLVALLLFIVIFGFYFHGTIFSIFLDQKYGSVSYLLGPMMLVSLLDGNTVLISAVLHTKKETKSLIVPKCTTGLSGIVLTLIGAYFYDLKGILFAFMINAIFKFIWFYSLTRKQYENPKFNL